MNQITVSVNPSYKLDKHAADTNNPHKTSYDNLLDKPSVYIKDEVDGFLADKADKAVRIPEEMYLDFWYTVYPEGTYYEEATGDTYEILNQNTDQNGNITYILVYYEYAIGLVWTCAMKYNASVHWMEMQSYSFTITETESNKLASLKNYDDAVVKSDITDLKNTKADKTTVYTKDQNDAVIVPLLIREYGAREGLRIFVQGNADTDLTTAVSRFYKAAAVTLTETYTSTFYLFDVSNSPDGWKENDNAGLVCEPSTNTFAGRDDYADLPLFMCVDCNYTIDPVTLEPVIHAVKGISGDYSDTPSDSFVGVIQMTGWVSRTKDDTTKTVSYRGQKTAGYMPLPEAVRISDNSVRSFVIHAKYAAGFNSSEKLSSISGVQPVSYRSGSAGSASVSHDAQIAQWRKWGTQYCGSSICDSAFLQLMLELKYAKLGNANVMSGCRSYYYSYRATISENGVKRILISTTNGATLIPGSRVSLGSGSRAASEGDNSVCDIASVDRIETVNVGGTDYSAVYLDAPITFNVDSETTHLITQPWRTGATDNVTGNDGSPFDNLSGKEPFKLQGIEVMLGAAEALADTSVRSNGSNAYNVWVCRKASNVVSGGYGTGAVLIGTIPNENTVAGYKYTAELNWQSDNDAYMLQKQDNAASSNGYRSNFNKVVATSANLYEWIAFGNLANGGGGLAGVTLTASLSYLYWGNTARACGTGGNRGKYTE